MVREDKYLVKYSFIVEGKLEIRYREVDEVIKNKYLELYSDTLPTESELKNLIEKVETNY